MKHLKIISLPILFAIVASCGPSSTSDIKESNITTGERSAQFEVFAKYLSTNKEVKQLRVSIEDLPTSGSVDAHRIPFSGYDYPDRAGGTDRKLYGDESAMQRYDRAFHPGKRVAAAAWERKDALRTDKTESKPRRDLDELARRRPLIARIRRNAEARAEERAAKKEQVQIPAWHGHCNGRTAMAIRHPEPRLTVERNGVRFAPSDIKALMIETYMYAPWQWLGVNQQPNGWLNAGTFHTVLANWIGIEKHPVGIETTPGEVKMNMPLYAFASKISESAKSPREISNNRDAEKLLYVETTVTLAPSLTTDPHRPYSVARKALYKYYLELAKNAEGQDEIIGGVWARGSAAVDFLWLSDAPVQADGQEILGNPFLDFAEIHRMYEESVPADVPRYRNIALYGPK